MAVGDFKWMGFVNKLEYNWPHPYLATLDVHWAYK